MIGADVVHRASGAEGRPSFTAVSSIDLMASKHFALSPIQAGSQEIINNLEEMEGFVALTPMIQVGCLSLTTVWYVMGGLGKYTEVPGCNGKM